MENYIGIVDRYQKLRADREGNAKRFLSGERPYMIYQMPEGDVWGDVRSPEQCFNNNIAYIGKSLDVPSDHLPVLEPWFGTGVYANMYGCGYVWREGQAPAVHYKYHTLEDVANLSRPSWEDGEIACMVVDTLKYFRSKTGNAIPMIWTDTQSAADTATLILDASETFIGCLTEPETVMNFMRGINDLIIEFSRVQAELIGDALVMPGHIMLCQNGLTGMSISDDNLAVASPDIDRNFNLVLDEEIGKAMGGVAIHSCGLWSHIMPFVKELVPSCVAVDCALDTCCDPNPNQAEKVRDAFASTGIHVHVRTTHETESVLQTVKRLLHPDLKLIVHPMWKDAETAKRNYDELDKLLSGFYRASR